ncbi:MAG: cation-transporting P-type ATPase [Mycobacterium sp.]|nr:cation-transporting P-type ATPase [Mycobacterium sp.]
MLRRSAALPGHAVGTSVRLATMPVRAAGTLVSGVTGIQSAAQVAVELVGGPRARRCWRGNGRAWIEVRGLHDPESGRALGERVVAALREQPDVVSVQLNYPLSRVVVSLTDDDSPVRELCDLVAEAETQRGVDHDELVELPGDGETLAARLAALTAASIGLGAVVVGRAVPWAKLPAGLPAPVAFIDYQPTLRHLVEKRLGTTATDTALAVAAAAVYTATGAWSSLAVDVMLHLLQAAESRSVQRTWSEREPDLQPHAASDDAYSVKRPCPLPPGPVERYGNASAAVQLSGAFALAVLTRNPNVAATAALVATPKAARNAREAFASTLARGLAEGRHALPLRAEALRRLDRVDTVLFDPRVLGVDGVHDPLAAAVVGEARRANAKVMSLDEGELTDLRPMFDELAPLAGGVDTALAETVGQLQRDGRTVMFVGAAAAQALSAADVAVGVIVDNGAVPWCADMLVDDLAGAWRLLHAVQPAARASRRGVELSVASSLLGALLMVPGVRGRGPGPVTAGAAAGMWTGFALGRKAVRAAPPTPAPKYEWHAMPADEVRRLLPERGQDYPPRRTGLRSPPIRAVSSARHAVGEFATTLRKELSDPLTPVLATGSAASAVLGSPADAVLVGSVLTLNSALAATQQVRAQRLLRRLLAVQEPPARRVTEDADGQRTYVDVDADGLRQGDVIEVRPGEVVPADARLIAVAELEVDESTLTGESLPLAKQTDAAPGAVLAERSCMLYGSTTVVAGTGRGIVTAVGSATEARRADALPRTAGGPVGLQARLRELTDRALPVSLAGGGIVSALALVRGAGLRQAVTSGVAVTVAAVPEGLALVATLAQQASARRLTKLGALVRNPRSIEALGRVDVVCFDKTGTLSENRLRVTAVYTAGGRRDHDVVSAAAAATPAADDAGRHAHATDAAIVEASGDSPDSEPAAHLPFRSGRPFSATVSGTTLRLKGAPEVILEACVDISTTQRRKVREMAGEGLRVIAVAEAELNEDQVAAACADPDAFAELCGGGLRFAGLLGLADTPRAEAADLLVALAEQNIGVRLITGDHPVTAAAIATQLGLEVAAGDVVSGNEWESMSRRDQERAVAHQHVFARMSPEHKVQIVETLERTGRVCAMVGDGANDAAAIRAATVGIGVAVRGSDPARTAADVMLLDGHISGLLDALDEGRKLWLRVQAAVSVLLGGNAGEVLFAIIGSAITGRSPLNTRQLLLVNMFTDGLPAAALAVSEPSGSATDGRGLDAAALWRAIGVRGATTAAGTTLAWTLASFTGRQQRASTVALVALVSTQLGQTLLDSRDRLVIATAAGSLLALGAVISTPGVSQLLGNTPLGPLGWSQAIGSAVAATLAAEAVGRILGRRRYAAPGEASADSPISTIPARQSTAYSSRNGKVSARVSESVNGSDLTSIGRFTTVPTVDDA